MRRSLLGAAGALVLVAAAVPAAHAKTFDVDGDRWSGSGLTFVSHSCSDRTVSPPTAPTFAINRGPDKPPMGLYSVGWRDNSIGYGTGVMTHIDKPAGLDTLRIGLNSLDTGAHGRVMAIYHAPGDEGIWVGNADLGDDATAGWHDVNAKSAVFSWLHFDELGNSTGGGGTYTLPAFANRNGGNGNGAEVGFIYGCDGNDFFVDRFQVIAGDQTKTFDLGGYNTRSVLKVGEKKPKKVIITIGQDFPISGYLYEQYQNTRIAGQLRFESRKIGGSKYQLIARESAGTGSRALLRIHPKKNTQYALQYAGNEDREPSRSNTLKVFVRVKVSANLADSTVARGSALRISGKIAPAKKTAFLLQRYGGGRWNTVKKGFTNGKGGYSVSAVPSSTGTAYWRILALGGGGNVGNDSKSMKVTVYTPSSGGGGGGGSTPPPPPPSDDPPPPEG